jgi:hypothetical protein
MVEALALEIGDSWPVAEEIQKGLGEFSGEESPVE